MKYHDMVIEASDFERKLSPEKMWQGRFKVRVFSSPEGEMSPEQAVTVQFDDGQLQASLQKIETRDLNRADLVALGRTLALLLFPPGPGSAATSVRGLLADNLKKLKPDLGLRLRLRLPPMLAAVPWEYVYVDRAVGGDGIDGFLALDPRVAIVRHEVLAAPLGLPLLSGDIKVVVAMASGGGPPLDLAKEHADLEKAFACQAGINPIFLPDATLDEIQAAMPEAGIFHFAGHGVYDRKQSDLPGVYTGTGSIALVDQNVDAEQLGINLRGCGVRLAVLGGCETGRREGVYVWGGIAPALIKAEVPAVVANQYKITDTCATAFSRQFYQAIVGGLPVERAVSAGRIGAYNADKTNRDWGVPVLYLRAADGQLFEGAADSESREKASFESEADFSVRAKNVMAGGEVIGGEVASIIDGKLTARVEVSGAVYGVVIGLVSDDLRGKKLISEVEVGDVEENGKVIGGVVGRRRSGPSGSPSEPKKE